AEHDLERDAARGVGLRVEEQLGVDDVVGVRAREVGHREGVEVAPVAQNAAAGVVEIEERLEVGELVGGTDGVDGGVGQADAVFWRETEHHLGFERALDVEVELDLGQAADEAVAGGVDGGHGGLPYYLPLVGEVGTVAAR